MALHHNAGDNYDAKEAVGVPITAQNGSVLEWLRKFLNNRAFSVQLDVSRSFSVQLQYGVLQESVLGPLFFILFTRCSGG